MTFARRAPLGPGVAAALCAVALGACSYNWTSVGPAGPAVIPHRGSAVVTIATRKQRLKMHHESPSFWSPGGESIMGGETMADGYHDLDVRTCKASWRWRAPAGPEPDGSDVPFAERGMIGPVRFYPDENKTKLMATNTATAQTWTAAAGLGQIASVTAVPAARRVVVTTVGGSILVYDVDANRVVVCP